MLNKKLAIFLFFLFVNFTFTLKILGVDTSIGIVIFLIFPFLILDYTRISLKIAILVICLFAILPFNSYGVSSILFFVLAGYAMREYDFNYIVWCNLICQILFLFVNALLLKTGHINDVCIQKAGVAHDFGYQNTNTFAIYIIYIICSLYLLMYRSYKVRLFLLIIIVAPIVYYATYSRSVILTSSLLLLSLVVPDSIIRKYVFNKISISMLYLFVPLITLYIVHNPVLWEYFNEVSSNRVIYISMLIESFSAKTIITGMPLPDEVMLDNIFFHILLYGGVIPLLFVLSQFYNIFINRLYPIGYLSFLLVFFFFGFIESCFINPFISGSYMVWMLLVGNKRIYDLKK